MSAFSERIPKWAVLFSLSILFSATNVSAQAAPETPKEKPAAAPQEKAAEPPNAAQIELLETKYRFEANGDSRKEVHALVKINSELGVRQFARLNFDYNRSFQSVEIPLVQVPITPGKNITVIAEVIALNYLVKVTGGYSPAEKLNQHMLEVMKRKTAARAWVREDTE